MTKLVRFKAVYDGDPDKMVCGTFEWGEGTLDDVLDEVVEGRVNVWHKGLPRNRFHVVELEVFDNELPSNTATKIVERLDELKAIRIEIDDLTQRVAQPDLAVDTLETYEYALGRLRGLHDRVASRIGN